MQQSKVFETGVGEVVGYEAQLQLKDDHKPVFRKARTVLYALKEKIEETRQDGGRQDFDSSRA